MQPIQVVSSSRERLANLQAELSDHFAADYLLLEEFPLHRPAQAVVIDLDFRDVDAIQRARKWLADRSSDAQVVIAIDDKASRVQFTQACAIGATTVLARPLTFAKLQRTLFRGADVLKLEIVETPEDPHDLTSEFGALHDAFAAAAANRSPDLKALSQAAVNAIDRIEKIGIADYLKIARNQQSQIDQHCISVMALAVAFARELGWARAETEKVALAALLHDIGKAGFPMEVLEKPQALSRQQSEALRAHAQLGHELLRSLPDLPADVLDAVLHHHEYLDGSGYPHGLKGTDVLPLTRLVAIVNVFATLTEHRPHKSSLSGPQAYRVLQSMGPKLDADLVRDFQPLSRLL